jgi:hypothetical protein
MRDIIVLIASRIFNGIASLALFFIIKKVLVQDMYVEFSKEYSIITLIATLSGGALSGLMLKKAFTTQLNKFVIKQWIIFFIIISVVVIEALIFISVLDAEYRMPVYFIILSYVFFAVALVDCQIRKSFISMTLIDSTRILAPLIILFILSHIRTGTFFSLKAIFWILSCGYSYGIYYCIFKVGFSTKGMKDISYLSRNWRSDLIFSFWFASFNAIAQVLIISDRNIISLRYKPLIASQIAYTADQVTKIFNGLIFPINTKLSSELGTFAFLNKWDEFSKVLKRGAMLSVTGGILLMIILFFGNSLVSNFLNKQQLNAESIIYYSLANTIYLTSLIIQKRYDFSKFKAWPTLLLVSSIVISYLLITTAKLFINFFFLATCIYFSAITILTYLRGRKLVLEH